MGRGGLARAATACSLVGGAVMLRAAPPLDIDPLGDSSVTLSWEETEGVVQLESSLNLRELNWVPVPTPPSLLLGRQVVAVPMLADEIFFRLRGNAALYVVNQQEDFVGFATFETAEGNVPPTTRLSRGAATKLTQPRAVVVTTNGRLLISRGNGGIVGWEKAAEAQGSTPPDLEVHGDATGLTESIAFAYDRDEDMLFVGTTQAAMGILVFEDVSGAGFDGEVPPDRKFGPDDRVPHSATGSTKMTIDALKLVDDTLYAADTSGLSVNSSRILAFDNAGDADGETAPVRTITGPWSKLRSIEIVDDRLYAADDSNIVFIVDGIGSASGNVSPKQVIIEGASVHVRAVIAFDEQFYMLDENNASVLALSKLPDGNDGSVAPDRVVDGFATRLRLPSYMYISRGYPD